MRKLTQQVDEVVIRFAGDSGDGMQLTGSRFTETTAIAGNDLSTLAGFFRQKFAHRPDHLQGQCIPNQIQF